MHLKLFLCIPFIYACVCALQKHPHYIAWSYCTLLCLSGYICVCAAAVLWSSWPRKALRQRAETLRAVTEGGGIQELTLSFTEPGGSLTLSVAPHHHHPHPHKPKWSCGTPLLQDGARHQSKVHRTPRRNNFWIIWRLLASHLSAASKTLAVP